MPSKPYRFPENLEERLKADDDVRIILNRVRLSPGEVVGFCRFHLREHLAQWEIQRYAGKVDQAGDRPLGVSQEEGDLKVAVCSKRRIEYRDGTAKEMNSFDYCQELPASTFVPSVDGILNLAHGLASFVRFVGEARGMTKVQVDPLVLPLEKWLDGTVAKLDAAAKWRKRLREALPLLFAEVLASKCPGMKREDCLFLAGRVAELAGVDADQSKVSPKHTIVGRMKKREQRRRKLARKWRQEQEAAEKRRQARRAALMDSVKAAGHEPAGGQKRPKKT